MFFSLLSIRIVPLSPKTVHYHNSTYQRLLDCSYSADCFEILKKELHTIAFKTHFIFSFHFILNTAIYMDIDQSWQYGIISHRQPLSQFSVVSTLLSILRKIISSQLMLVLTTSSYLGGGVLKSTGGETIGIPAVYMLSSEM